MPSLCGVRLLSGRRKVLGCTKCDSRPAAWLMREGVGDTVASVLLAAAGGRVSDVSDIAEGC